MGGKLRTQHNNRDSLSHRHTTMPESNGRVATFMATPNRNTFDKLSAQLLKHSCGSTVRLNRKAISSTWCNKGLSSAGTQSMLIAVLCLTLSAIIIKGVNANGLPPPPHTKFSQLLSMNGEINGIKSNAEDVFRPFVPKDPAVIARNVFTPSGQFHVFQPIESDLRTKLSMSPNAKARQDFPNITVQKKNKQVAVKKENTKISKDKNQHRHRKADVHHKSTVTNKTIANNGNGIQDGNDLASDLRSLEELLVEYAQNFFEKGEYEPMPGLLIELQSNNNNNNINNTKGDVQRENSLQEKNRPVRHAVPTDAKIHFDMPRTMATGRLLFLTGLKKILWPVFMGLQVLKSLLIAMFIPALIGSFTKLLGKGISQGSAPLFIRPMDPPQELDFRDNSVNFDEDSKFLINDNGMKGNGPYAYNQAESSPTQNQYAYTPVASAANNNPLGYTRLGMNERQHQLMQDSYMNALQSITSASFKNSNQISGGSSALSAPMVNKPPAPANMNTFQQFQKVPASSLLLSNYDPFYSPLLSRLDSVFGQLKLNSDNESCREKAICLMYANPAKYAPYSNLVSAQLSRELNELRKPTSDNPDILRFFKYMRAAKDGQDGVDCEKTFDNCAEFKDFENPAMVSTYIDINKLVQARKLT